jgi:GT2 family glycosyltransferase
VTPAIAAILVNYNAGDELRTALASVRDEADGSSWEAVVVDNASVDGSAAIAEEFAPQARLLRNRENVGFGRGVNQGLAASTAPIVLVMNPDCRLAPGALAALRAELERHDRCAMVGPRILNPDGSVQGSARGDPDMFTGLFGRTSALQRFFPGLTLSRRNVVAEAAIASGNGSVVVDWLSGACFLARRASLEAVGGFDRRFFLYWEDADLCRRLRAKGEHVRYVPGATATHRVGHSSRTAQAAAIRAFHESAYLYYATHVAPHPLSPKRLVARVLLGLRYRWRLLQDLRRSG